MRGKPVVFPRGRGNRRIIPAHAGQTPVAGAGGIPATDHPRACGANLSEHFRVSTDYGSSPRMRGKQSVLLENGFDGRIIPAHAGQTSVLRVVPTYCTDHPRACGANGDTAHALVEPCGSSPRMRGKQSDFMRKLLSAGPSIIGFAQWLQSSYYCSCLQSSAKTPISRGTTPTSLFLGFQNSITLLLLT